MPQKRESLLSTAWSGGHIQPLGRGRKRSNSESDSDSSDGGQPRNGHYSANSVTNGRVRKKLSAYQPDSGRVVGIIERVRLENFMCHSEFEWRPNPCVNFVTGSNGSGKSSVLQGLVLGLLGESRNIKRYSKVSDFIKKDTGRAVIQVTLRNTGEDAYKPEIYGSSLTFQRTIFETGSSAYLLKDENMRDVVRKSKDAKEECRRILDKFQIQVDSPIVILQQDDAKELLKVESPRSLYMFYEKATLIRQCQEKYEAAQMEYARATETLKEKTRSLRHMGTEFKKANARYDEILKFQQMDEELITAKGEYAWARVHAARENIVRIQDNIRKLTERQEQPRSKLMALHEKLAEMKLRKTEIEVELEDETSKYSSLDQDLMRSKEEIDRLKLDKKKLENNLKAETTNKNSLITETRVISEQLDTIVDRTSKEDRARKDHQIKMVLAKLEADRRGLDEQIEREGQARELVEQQMRQDEDKEVLINNEIRLKTERKAGLRAEIEELEGASEQHLAVFGAKIPLVDRAIKRYINKFKKPPIGPVGAFVKLKGEAATNPDLARLVETELSRPQLTAYLTNDDDDRRAMMRVLDEVYGADRQKPRIFTSRFIYRNHNVVRPPTTQPLLMDYIQVDNPVVFNHLVDQKNIESILVCRTQDDAKRLMTRVETVPANSAYAITHDFYRFFPPKGNSTYRSYYIDQLMGSGMLRATMSNLVKEKRDELAGLTQHLEELEGERQEVLRSKRSYEAEKKRAMAQIQKLRSQMATLNSQMSQVRCEEEGGQEENADNLRARLITRQTELTVAHHKIRELQSEKEMLSDLIKEKEEMLKENKKKFTELKSASNPLQKELHDIENKITAKTKEISNQETGLKRLKAELEAQHAELKRMEEEERDFAVSARKITKQEMFPDKTVKQLSAKLSQLKKRQLMAMEKEGERNVEAFVTQYNELRLQYEDMKKKVDELNRLLETVDKMRKCRETNFAYIRDVVATNVRRKFNLMIGDFAKQTGSQIFLRIDVKRKELRFNFSSAANNNSLRSNSDVSTLSGGEKSFTQMCLICSLWEVMQPPFRCLDEWDVFLDAVNRKAISQELLRFSLRNKDSQFIFISPQGACDLKDVDHGAVSVTEIIKS